MSRIRLWCGKPLDRFFMEEKKRRIKVTLKNDITDEEYKKRFDKKGNNPKAWLIRAENLLLSATLLQQMREQDGDTISPLSPSIASPRIRC